MREDKRSESVFFMPAVQEKWGTKGLNIYYAGSYDVAVIGAGHAGCEAALASARLGMSAVLFCINLDSVANLACNPSIGGTAKGHLVREIDALGGEMGKAADKTFLQSRILNKGKGPAVYSLRVQTDRRAYQMLMKHTIEQTDNLDLKQQEVIDIIYDDGKVQGVVTHTGACYSTKAVIISTGTFLKGKILVGNVAFDSGPDGIFPSVRLSDSLKEMGIRLLRFKTGTPARINRRSVDFSVMEEQPGDEDIVAFSFETDDLIENKLSCYLTYTNQTTHRIIKDNLHLSPMYSGKIEGVGARYCPSIEDKVVRFKDKEKHQIFIEPMGMDTEELYVQGLSTSLPEEVQVKMLHSIQGLENAKIMRTAYAIEYDCIDPSQLLPTLEFKDFPNLYGAGQFNGSSGYEEAAAQGLVSGINAARKIQGKKPIVLERSQSYMGTLIDDLVTKGTNEPYRMMTSRSEYRLLLRQDNADMRMTPLGYEIGLISEERYHKFLKKKSRIEAEIKRLEETVIPPDEKVHDFLKKYNSSGIITGIKASDLLKRPEINYHIMSEIDPHRPVLTCYEAEQVEIQIKYQGYIQRQLRQVEQFKKLERKLLPDDMDYQAIGGLRIEAKQKLEKIRPASLGQASRISGVSPADISVLLIYLEQRKGGRDKKL